MVELAHVTAARECCGEQYLLVEQQRGVLVRRWFTRANDPEQRPLTACACCAAPLLAYPAGELVAHH